MNKEIHENIIETEKILLNINEVDAIEYSIWTKEKAKLKYNGIIPNFPIYNNFIYWCNLGINIGSEQNTCNNSWKHYKITNNNNNTTNK